MAKKTKKPPRKDGRYEICKTIWLTPHNKVVKHFYGATKEEAERKYFDFLKAQERDKLIGVRFDKWADTWLEEYKRMNVKESSFDSSYRRPVELHLIPYFKDTPMQDITPLMLRSFLNKKANFSQSYICKLIICIKGIFSTAQENGHIDKNPALNLAQKSRQEVKRKRAYTEHTVEVLKASSLRMSLSSHIFLALGLRCSELCSLKWENVDLNEGKVTVIEARTMQGGVGEEDEPKSFTSRRRLDIPTDLLAKLKREKELASSDYVVTYKGKPANPDHFFEKFVAPFYVELGISEDKMLTPHELRHTCGTILYKQTKDIFHVSRFLGHSDISLTSRVYVHSEINDEFVEAFPND
jgi:integrase